MEERLAELFHLIMDVINEKVHPVVSLPAVLNGNDLITHFQLEPGPVFGEILLSLEQEQVTRGKMTKPEALEYVAAYLKRKNFR